VTPAQVVAAARVLVVRADGSAAQVWPRVGAFLARQALEESLAALWHRSTTMHSVLGRSMRTQLTCLRFTVPDDLARDVAMTWAALSRACHYHPYELAPTAAELDGWFGAVDRLMVRLGEHGEAEMSGDV
jgi:hypothetical protein